MAGAGRRPKLQVVKELEGKRSHGSNRRRRTAATASVPLPPEEPDWRTVFPAGPRGTPAARRAAIERLRKDASREWQRVVPPLSRLGILSRQYRTTVVDYVVTWAQLQGELREWAVEGSVIPAARADRGWVKNPRTTVISQLRLALKAYIVELGLSPSAAGRLELPSVPEGDDDDHDDLLPG